MSNTSINKVGTFLRIPLADGSFGYAQVLMAPYIAFYNCRTMEPSSDLEMVSSQALLFSQAVRKVGLSKWEIIGQRPLEGEAAEPVVMYRQDLADFSRCVIFDSVGMEKNVRPEDCSGIEAAAVWEAHHIEERLLDIFMGRTNAQEASLRVRLE